MCLRIYTDGACSDNPGGCGGWAAIYSGSKGIKEIGGYEFNTTNNRMEMLAVIKALEGIDRIKNKYDVIEVHSDSAYVVNAINCEWITKWKFNGWKTSKKEPVQNKDLWEILDKLVKKHKPIMVKVKGHAGNTLNEMCDARAKAEVLKAKEEINK